MSKKEKKTQVVFEIILPKAQKVIKSSHASFTAFLTSIEENKNRWGAEVKSIKSKNRIFIGSRELKVFMVFKKKIALEMDVNEPDKNKNISKANEMAKNVIAVINAILGDGANGSIVTVRKRIAYDEASINLSKRLIGNSRIAKINEQAGQTLTPFNIMFDYQIDDKSYLVCFMEGSETAVSYRTYKDAIPFNLLEIEYGELENPVKVIEKLTNMRP